MQRGLISVLLPIRDWRITSGQAINSILGQHYSNLELLLIGQEDLQPLAEKLQAIGINDARIRLVARKSTGIVNALNAGLAHASGEFIARMDDDDVAYPERFERQLNYLHQHPDVHLCGAGVRFIDSEGGVEGVASGNRRYAAWLNQLTEPETIANACFAENPMPHPTLFAHHTIWRQLEGYHEVDGPEDHDLVLRAMLAGMRMGKPEALLLDWREHENRLTHTDKRYHRAAFIAQSAKAWERQRKAVADNDRSVWIAGTGKQARQWHDELVANGISVQGFIDIGSPGSQRSKRLLPIISYDELVRIRSNEMMVNAVSQPAGRRAVLAFFSKQGWREGHDFIVGA